MFEAQTAAMSKAPRRGTPPPKSEVEEIAYRLRLTSAALDMTAAEICRTTGIAANTYSQWVNATGRPELDKAKLLCQVLGYTLDWIYLGDIASLRSDLASKVAVLKREWDANGEPLNGRRKPSKN